MLVSLHLKHFSTKIICIHSTVYNSLLIFLNRWLPLVVRSSNPNSSTRRLLRAVQRLSSFHSTDRSSYAFTHQIQYTTSNPPAPCRFWGHYLPPALAPQVLKVYKYSKSIWLSESLSLPCLFKWRKRGYRQSWWETFVSQLDESHKTQCLGHILHPKQKNPSP